DRLPGLRAAGDVGVRGLRRSARRRLLPRAQRQGLAPLDPDRLVRAAALRAGEARHDPDPGEARGARPAGDARARPAVLPGDARRAAGPRRADLPPAGSRDRDAALLHRLLDPLVLAGALADRAAGVPARAGGGGPPPRVRA